MGVEGHAGVCRGPPAAGARGRGLPASFRRAAAHRAFGGQGPRASTRGARTAAGRTGQPVLSGPFRVIRHPDNLFFALFLWALPRMSVNRLTLALLSTGYAVVGSWHEDARLRGVHGASFARYQRTTPLLHPALPSGGRGPPLLSPMGQIRRRAQRTATTARQEVNVLGLPESLPCSP